MPYLSLDPFLINGVELLCEFLLRHDLVSFHKLIMVALLFHKLTSFQMVAIIGVEPILNGF